MRSCSSWAGGLRCPGLRASGRQVGTHTPPQPPRREGHMRQRCSVCVHQSSGTRTTRTFGQRGAEDQSDGSSRRLLPAEAVTPAARRTEHTPGGDRSLLYGTYRPPSAIEQEGGAPLRPKPCNDDEMHFSLFNDKFEWERLIRLRPFTGSRKLITTGTINQHTLGTFANSNL